MHTATATACCSLAVPSVKRGIKRGPIRSLSHSMEQRTLPKALSAVLSAADKDKDKDKDKDEEINELKRAVRKLQQHNSILEGILNTKQAELARQEAELLTARSVIPTQAPLQAPPLATTGLSRHTNALRLAARELRTEARAARRETFMLGGGTVDELRPDWARSLCSSLVAVRVPGECGWGARGCPAAALPTPHTPCACARAQTLRPRGLQLTADARQLLVASRLQGASHGHLWALT